MKRPSFQFYPADWKGNSKLRRCSEAARGVWMDILCVLHDSDEYGVVRWPLAELARAAGAALKLVKELVDRQVLKGADHGPVTFTHTPRHAGKDGEPVTLIDGQGPIWFSSRMVTDEWRRSVSGGKTRYKSVDESTEPVTTPRQGEALGDGATSPSPPIESKKVVLSNFIVGKGGGKEPMTDQNKIALFQKWLATSIGRNGWLIVGTASDPGADGYEDAVAFCRAHAKKNGKGWPHKWPSPQMAAE